MANEVNHFIILSRYIKYLKQKILHYDVITD